MLQSIMNRFLKDLVAKWKKGRKMAHADKACRRQSFRPMLEALEDRTVPTILFNPAQSGPEVFNFNDGTNPAVTMAPSTLAVNNPYALNSPKVYFIFVGPQWKDVNGNEIAAVKQMTSAAKAIVDPSSPYSGGLAQYGSLGRATYGAYTVDTSLDPWKYNLDSKGNPTSPAWYETDQILNQSSFSSWYPNPAPSDARTSPIYVVVRYVDPGRVDGWNNFGPNGSTKRAVNVIDLNLSSTNNVDGFSWLFSHELVERLSAGTGDSSSTGIYEVSPDLLGTQIGDGEPEGSNFYAWRLKGVNGAASPVVTSYWSVADQAFIVPDGSRQNLLMDPIVNGTNGIRNFVNLEQGKLSIYSAPDTNTPIETNVQSYVTDRLGNVFYLTNSGQVKEYNASGITPLTSASFKPVSTIVEWYGSVYMLANSGTYNQIWKYTPATATVAASWTLLTSSNMTVKQLAADPGALYFLGHVNGGPDRVWADYGGSGSWTAITDTSTPVSQIASSHGGFFSSNTLYRLDSSGQVFKYNAGVGSWASVADQPANISQIAPAYGGLYVLAPSTDSYNYGLGHVSKYWDVGSWTALTGDHTVVNQIATSGYDLYMEGFNVDLDPGPRPEVYQYSGSGTNWNHLTQVPTYVYQLALHGSSLYMVADNGPGQQFWHYWGPGTNWHPLVANAPPGPITRTTAPLSVLAAGEGGDTSLTFTWAAIAKPNGARPTFSVNGTNAAQNTTVTFDRPGNYTFQVTIRDPGGMSATSAVNVTVAYPNLTGESFHFTNNAYAGLVIGTLQISSEDVGTGSFRGSYFSDLNRAFYAVSGTVSSPSGIGGYTNSSITFQGTTPVDSGVQQVSFSGTVQDYGNSLRWMDHMSGRLTDGGVWLPQSRATVETATASSTVVHGKTTDLAVLDGDGQGNASLTFNWTVAAAPSGAQPTFSVNHSNAAKNTTVTFDRAGRYTLFVNIIDPTNGSAITRRTLNVTVKQTLTSIAISPANVTVSDGAMQLFIAAGNDQFGHPLAVQPAFNWSLVQVGVVPIVGTLKGNLFTAPSSGRGTDTIMVTSGSVSGTATVTVVDGTTGIAIGALSDPYLLLDGKSVSRSSSQRLTLTPGSHTLQEVNAGSVAFVVNANGTVSYDRLLEGVLNGQGTDQLTVNGALVTIDARALTDPYLEVDYYTSEQPGTFQARLLPGSHTVQEANAGSVSFIVNADGTMSYEQTLGQAGILSTPVKAQLTVNGALVTIDAQALTDPYLELDYYTSERPGTFQARLLPGSHTVQEANAGSVNFVVNPNGTVSYDRLLEGVLNGQGTDQLTVNGALVTINAQALTDPYLELDYYTSERPGTFQARLLPGSHTVQEANAGSVSFIVNADGTISYEQTLGQAGILSGLGGQVLTVIGAPIAIDARALGSSSVFLDYYTQKQTGSVFYVTLLPGKHRLQIYGGGAYDFTITPEGFIVLDSSSANLLSLQGSQTLIVKALS